MTEAVAGPLISLAFTLIDTHKSVYSTGTAAAAVGIGGHKGSMSNTGGSWENVLSTTVHSCVSPPLARRRGPAQFGAWVLIKVFLQCEYARSSVVRDIVLRLSIAASYCSSSDSSSSDSSSSASAIRNRSSTTSTTTTTTTSSSSASTVALLISLLTQLVHLLPQALWSLSGDLQEAFVALVDLTPQSASNLISALAPLFPQCPSLADRSALALRKLTFSREVGSRLAAVGALMGLVKAQLSCSSGGGSGGSSSSAITVGDTSTSRRRGVGENTTTTTPQVGLSLTELQSLIRRFFSYQSVVRVHLYEHLYQLQLLYPLQCREVVLRMLLGHVRELLGGRGGGSDSSGSYSSGSDSSGGVTSSGILTLIGNCIASGSRSSDSSSSGMLVERVGEVLCTLLAVCNTTTTTK